MTEQPEHSVDTRTLIILAFSATAGVLVEFYDFLIYGFAAASAFPSIFFPGLRPTQALVLSYLAFGAHVLWAHLSSATSATAPDEKLRSLPTSSWLGSQLV